MRPPVIQGSKVYALLYKLYLAIIAMYMYITINMPLLVIFPHCRGMFQGRNWQLQASAKVAKCGDLWTEKHSIFGNFKV